MKYDFDVEGMTCAACQAHVENAVKKLNVDSVSVSLLSNSMQVETSLPPSAIEEAVKKAGYAARLKGAKTPVPQKRKDFALVKLICSIVLLLVLMYFSMGNMMWDFPAPAFVDHSRSPMGFALVQFVLVIPILLINKQYFTSGFQKLFRGKPNMDSLIAIGASASVLYGIFALFMMSYSLSMLANGGGDAYRERLMQYHDSLYFESAGMILTLVSLGKYLEGLSKKRTTDAVTRLIDMSPKLAIILKDGLEVQISADEVKAGDIVVVKAGADIPVDGVVTAGVASVDQANITGESMPVEKREGDEVFSSTTVSAGYLKLRATKVGEDTSFANIIRLVEEAANSKAPISRLADKISGVFVPVIFTIALVTLVANLLAGAPFERALNFAITVVVIACPCALGLATPVAIMAGTGKGAENGLIIKNAEILEKAHNIGVVVLDKTGTITEGKPQVTDFITLNGADKPRVLSIVYSLELMSEHPLASSLTAYCEKNNAVKLPAFNFEATPGQGVKATVDGQEVFIGNARITDDEETKKLLSSLSSEGKTPLAVLIDGAPKAVIAAKDEVKAGSKEAVKELKAKGIRVIMLTGDNAQTAKRIADEVGVDEVISDVLPQDKQEVISSLKTDEKRLVAMVGDGVNDAPALGAADLAIAVGGGSDVAIQTSDIVLLRKDLLDVVNVISLSKRVLFTIKLGLFWAFFYNAVCVVFATGAFSYIDPKIAINPMIGSLAMSISSVSVVLNALTINLFKVKRTSPSKEAPSQAQTLLSQAESELQASENTLQESKNADLHEVSATQKAENEGDEETLTINVKGMMCENCVRHVKRACESVQGVREATVDLEKGQAVILGHDLDIEKISDAIRSAGYEVIK